MFEIVTLNLTFPHLPFLNTPSFEGLPPHLFSVTALMIQDHAIKRGNERLLQGKPRILKDSDASQVIKQRPISHLKWAWIIQGIILWLKTNVPPKPPYVFWTYCKIKSNLSLSKRLQSSDSCLDSFVDTLLLNQNPSWNGQNYHFWYHHPKIYHKFRAHPWVHGGSYKVNGTWSHHNTLSESMIPQKKPNL